MKSIIRSGREHAAHFFACALLLLGLNTLQAQLLQDPSFELAPASLPGAEHSWSICRGTPDWQVLDGYGTGINGVATPAATGQRYIGLLDTEFETREAVGQMLMIESGIHHFGSVALFRSSAHQSWNGTGQFQLWGGSACGDFAELLWSSGTVSNVDAWQTYSINFSASGNHQWLMATVVLDAGSGEMTYLGVDDLRLDNSFLAVDYLAFEAQPQPRGVQLDWEVVPLLETEALAIEWSHDGADFQEVGLLSGEVNASSFQFFHTPTASGAQFYRIRSVSLSGQRSWSNVIQTQWSPAIEVLVYPNPLQHQFSIQMPASEELMTVQLLDLQGRLVADWGQLPLQQLTLSLPSAITDGSYVLQIIGKSAHICQRLTVLR